MTMPSAIQRIKMKKLVQSCKLGKTRRSITVSQVRASTTSCSLTLSSVFGHLLRSVAGVLRPAGPQQLPTLNSTSSFSYLVGPGHRALAEMTYTAVILTPIALDTD